MSIVKADKQLRRQTELHHSCSLSLRAEIRWSAQAAVSGGATVNTPRHWSSQLGGQGGRPLSVVRDDA